MASGDSSIFNDFDDPVKMRKTYCEQVSAQEYTDSVASETDKALGELCLLLDKQPDIYANVLRKRKREEMEKEGPLSFMKSKVLGLVKGEEYTQNLVSDVDCLRQTNALKNSICRTFQYAQELKAEPTQPSPHSLVAKPKNASRQMEKSKSSKKRRATAGENGNAASSISSSNSNSSAAMYGGPRDVNRIRKDCGDGQQQKSAINSDLQSPNRCLGNIGGYDKQHEKVNESLKGIPPSISEKKNGSEKNYLSPDADGGNHVTAGNVKDTFDEIPLSSEEDDSKSNTDILFDEIHLMSNKDESVNIDIAVTSLNAVGYSDDAVLSRDDDANNIIDNNSNEQNKNITASFTSKIQKPKPKRKTMSKGATPPLLPILTPTVKKLTDNFFSQRSTGTNKMDALRPVSNSDMNTSSDSKSLNLTMITGRRSRYKNL